MGSPGSRVWLWLRRLTSLAVSLGAGISMGFAEALSDDGSLTGRGGPWVRGLVCGLMTALGGLGHTLPYLIPHFNTATAVAVAVVLVELSVIAYIRHHYMDTPVTSALFQVVVGGVLVFLTGILIGSNVGFVPGSAIINSGTIIGSVASIDVSKATSAVTIDQTGEITDVNQSFRLGHDQACAERHRAKDLRQRSIEAHRRQLQHTIFGGHGPLGDEAIRVLGDRVMCDRHTFGPACRAGSVDNVGQVLGT